MATSDVLKRIKNMVFTTSDNYGINIDVKGANSYTDAKENVTISTSEALETMGLTSDEALQLVMHSAAHEGAHVKYSKLDGIKKVLKQAQKEGANVEVLSGLIQIAEDCRVDGLVTKERPGYGQMRKEDVNIAKKMFKDKPSGDDEKDFLKATSFFAHDNTDLRTAGWDTCDIDWESAKDTARKLEEIAEKSNSSIDLVKKVYSYYKERYAMEEPPEDSETPDMDDTDDLDGEDGDTSDKEDEKKSKGKAKRAKSNKGNGDAPHEDVDYEDSDEDPSDDSDEGDEESGEDTSEEGCDSYKPSADSDSTDEDLEAKLEKAFKDLKESMKGESEELKKLLGEDASSKLERTSKSLKRDKDSLDSLTAMSDKQYKNFTGIHGKYKPLWSEQEHKQITEALCVGVHAGADILYGIDTRPRKDVSEYSLHEHDGDARILGNKLIQVLKAEKNNNGYVASSGSSIIANKVWKPIHTGDVNVFNHKDFTESGGYVIDLVLDASGSQAGRGNDIAVQAYVIAEACSIAGIPCRVTQFRNSGSFTILERIRDFDDPETKNINCNTFSAGGDNRDGLALKMADIELQKRKEENKIMLVLSDGVPCDASGYTKINKFGGLASYKANSPDKDSGASPAVRDVYDVVQKIRKSGTALMGIYVGSSTWLPTEQLMYGNEFAYVGTSMTNFVSIVMRYLVKHIQGFDN